MKDRTKPLPAPAGFKWVVSETWLQRNGVPCFELGLWPEGVVVDALGLSRDGFLAATAHSHFTKEKQILRASKEALKEYSRGVDRGILTDRLVGVLR